MPIEVKKGLLNTAVPARVEFLIKLQARLQAHRSPAHTCCMPAAPQRCTAVGSVSGALRAQGKGKEWGEGGWLSATFADFLGLWGGGKSATKTARAETTSTLRT